MNPEAWVASGHVVNFTDPLIDCKSCKMRHRADKLIEDFNKEKGIEMLCDGMSNDQLYEYIVANSVVCPGCGKATRVKHAEVDGKKVRVCKCGTVLDKAYSKKAAAKAATAATEAPKKRTRKRAAKETAENN